MTGTTTIQIDRTFTPIEGGWYLRTAGAWHVYIFNMGFNWRIVQVHERDADGPLLPYSLGRGWCYPKHLVRLSTVIAQALGHEPADGTRLAYDPEAGTEPTGWIKEAGTERRACNGYYPHQNAGHQLQDPECRYCG